MLLFIYHNSHCIQFCSWFQYISCYSLSQEVLDPDNEFQMFQYISCYSLSPGFRNEESQRRQFQYISCYSLSLCSRHIRPNSHRFNTSHVTLYQTWQWGNIYQSGVSIHLMLLFIKIMGIQKIPYSSFNTSHVTLYPSFYRLFFF